MYSVGSSYKPDGLLFDEVAPSTTNQDLYSGYSTYAKSKISNAAVTLNRGQLYRMPTTDLARVTREDYYSSFSPSQYTVGTSTPASQQAVILRTTGSTVPTYMVNATVHVDKIGAVYFTEDVPSNPYDAFPTYWSSLVDAVQAAATA